MTSLSTPATFPSNGKQANNVIAAYSPATGRPLGTVTAATPEEIRAAMRRARDAQKAWFAAGLPYRIAIFKQWQNTLQNNMELIINAVVNERGGPPFEALVEYWASIETIAQTRRIAPRALAPREVFTPQVFWMKHWVTRQPYGVVLVISPWNYPLYLVLPPIAEALIAGNTVILKPSEFSPQVAEIVAKTIQEAGFPPGVFQMLHGRGDVGAALIREKPDKISFTGSVPTGRKVAAQAGEMLIPVRLELGAKDAAIVLDDADLDFAAHGVLWGAMFNAGQTCIGIERCYVSRAVYEPFVQKLVEKAEQFIKVGPGEAIGTTMGALTTEAQYQIVESQVREAVEQGAKVRCGGGPADTPSGRGYLPTILTDVTPDMRLMREETFGPVLPVIPVDSDEEAIRLTNSLPFGITVSIWTRSRERGLHIGRLIETGHVSLNDHILAHAVPQTPWVGVKESGMGSSHTIEGIQEMTYPKSYSVPRFLPILSSLMWYPYANWKYAALLLIIRFGYAPNLWRRLMGLLSGR
jgi:acyl-CoA reductase-like NAD-dependent aldehyde dehydrogenase